MARLNNQKAMLLNQVKNQPNTGLQKLVSLVATYEDLAVEDFKGYISPDLYEQLKEAGRDPNELQLWNDLSAAPTGTPEQIQAAQRLAATYIQQFPSGPKINEANQKMNALQAELNNMMRRAEEERRTKAEQAEWDRTEKGNYNALLNYKQKYPNSVHLNEIDELMWTNTKIVMSSNNLQRYLSDWPGGAHAQEASKALEGMAEWEEVKQMGDLFMVDDYRDNHPNSPFKREIDSLYFNLRSEKLKEMKEAPSEVSKDDVDKLIKADIFKKWELIDEELMTEESWETLFETDRNLFPNLSEYQIEDPNIQAPDDCTDIFLFGTPGTGKTCLLMGLTGATGSRIAAKDGRQVGYTLNMKAYGGEYASALKTYVEAGITPGRTFGHFVTFINGQVHETDKRNRTVSHKVNLVEMSGEEFALRIAEGKEVSLANMGTGATNLMRNNNRKVFFIIVDASKAKIKVDYIDQVKDGAGNVIDERVRKKYIYQNIILDKFVSLFGMEENREIMKNVDAIHFVVTKADMLGDKNTRLGKARDLLLNEYASPVEQLKFYCRQTKRINYATNYCPQVFTFSLGKFYLGDVFDFQKEETLKIIDTIRLVTSGTREQSWWDRVKEKLG